MNDPIRDYISANRDKYTREAIREQLLAAGHDTAAVDAALDEFATPPDNTQSDAARKTYRRWTLGLHAAVFVAVVGGLWLIYGSRMSNYLGIGAVILALLLLVGWAVSSLIGRAVLSPNRLAAALVVPALSALVIGGACFAMLSSTARPPERAGTLTIQVTGGLTFAGSVPAICSGTPGSGSMSIYANEVLTTGDGDLSASVSIYREGGVGPVIASISVSLYKTQNPGGGTDWSTDGREQSSAESSADQLSGTVTFSQLMSDKAPEAGPLSPALAGSIQWNCP